MLVSLVYRAPLTDEWDTLAKQLAEQLNIKIIGRSRGVKRVLTEEYVVEEIAKIKEIPVEEVIRITTENAKKIYGIK